MTEAEWLDSRDPWTMLYAIGEKASERKLKLFSCHCCRRIWPALADERSRRAVELAERYVDGLASFDELAGAGDDARAVEDELEADGTITIGVSAAGLIGLGMGHVTAAHVAEYTSREAANLAAGEEDDPATDQQAWEYACDNEVDFQAGLLRDIFGNPFRPVAVDPAWLTSTVVELARGIYDERAFDRLPILADALQDAGCDNAGVLAHCRGPGPHARGCWVVDLILGKT